jgi:DNA-binding response OmpR family regulator
MTQQTVVLLHEDRAASALLESLLRDVGYRVLVSETGLGAGELVAEAAPCVVLLSATLPYGSGLPLLTRRRSVAGGAAARFVLLGPVEQELLPALQRRNVVAALPWPSEPEAVLAAVRAAWAQIADRSRHQARLKR